MTSVSSANKEQSLTEKEKKVERDNASKLAHALGIDMTVLNNSMALAIALHRFGKNRGARSMTSVEVGGGGTRRDVLVVSEERRRFGYA